MIFLKDNYYLKGDYNCFALTEETETKKGITYKPIAFYTTIEDAIKGFIKMKGREYLNTTDIQTINDLILFQKNLYEEIKKNMSSLE